MKSPAFQWYPKDILSSHRVAMMTLCEEGAYRRALDFCWLHGFVPADTKQLCKMIGKNCSAKIAEVVKEMFVKMPGDETKLIHERLEAEREKQEEYRGKMKANAEKRWNKPDAGALPKHMPLQSKSSALHSSVSNLHSALDVNDDDYGQELETFRSFEKKLRNDEHFVETCRISNKLSLTDFENAIKEFFEQKVAGLDYKKTDMLDEGTVRKNFMYWIPGWKLRNRKEKNRPTYGNNNTNKPDIKHGRISESVLVEYFNRKFE